MVNDITFGDDLGESGAALGTYDENTDQMNINLFGIQVAGCLDFFGVIPEPPNVEQYLDAYHNHLIREIVRIICHEWIHRLLTALEGGSISLAYDQVFNDYRFGAFLGVLGT